MNILDPIGASCSLLCTYYFTQANTKAFILGIITILINSVLYFQKGIYGHVGLEVIYFASMLYGLYKWRGGAIKPNKNKASKIKILPNSIFLLLGLGSILTISALSLVLSFYTKSTVPILDATTTVLSLMAQGLLVLKFIHCWLIWFIVDALVVVMQFKKQIPFHSFVHILYTGMAVTGFLKWRKLYLAQQTLKHLEARAA